MAMRDFPTPPRWPRAALRALLPRDAAGDAIAGDLHEEFVRDAARHGEARARTLYWRRAAGVLAHATFDELRLRTWASDVPVPARAAAARPAAARVRLRADLGVGAIAFGLLAVGIVANTLLFASVRGAPRGAAHGASAAGLGGTALAVACTAAAAVVLCTGPRWLRRRLARQLAHGAPAAAE